MFRFLVPAGLLLLPLGGCGETTAWVLGGENCSLVRWDRGQAFCVTVPAPPPPAFCSRALGGVDCWDDPALLANRPRGLADNPSAPLTPRKEPGMAPPTKQAEPKPPPPAAPSSAPAPAPVPVPAPMPAAKASHATDYGGL